MFWPQISQNLILSVKGPHFEIVQDWHVLIANLSPIGSEVSDLIIKLDQGPINGSLGFPRFICPDQGLIMPEQAHFEIPMRQLPKLIGSQLLKIGAPDSASKNWPYNSENILENGSMFYNADNIVATVIDLNFCS